MHIEKTLRSLDALVWVHLDYEEILPEDFIRTVAYATFFAESYGVPVIAIPDRENSGFELIPEPIKDNWIITPESVYGTPTTLHNHIPSEKPKEEQRIGFGGLYYDCCVGSLALRTSREYNGPYLQVPMIYEENANPKVKEGIVIKELCL